MINYSVLCASILLDDLMFQVQKKNKLIPGTQYSKVIILWFIWQNLHAIYMIPLTWSGECSSLGSWTLSRARGTVHMNMKTYKQWQS